MSIIRVGGGRRKAFKVPVVPELDRSDSAPPSKVGKGRGSSSASNRGPSKRKKSGRGSAKAAKAAVVPHGQRTTTCRVCGARVRVARLARHLRKVHPRDQRMASRTAKVARVKAATSARSSAPGPRHGEPTQRSAKVGQLALKGGGRDNSGRK
jgi:hypothetical protein